MTEQTHTTGPSHVPCPRCGGTGEANPSIEICSDCAWSRPDGTEGIALRCTSPSPPDYSDADCCSAFAPKAAPVSTVNSAFMDSLRPLPPGLPAPAEHKCPHHGMLIKPLIYPTGGQTHVPLVCGVNGWLCDRCKADHLAAQIDKVMSALYCLETKGAKPE